jgi:putative ABC transport system permease protein
MRGVWLLSWRHLNHHKGRAAIVSCALALAVWLPAAVGLLIARYEADLSERAASTPLVAGARGNRFDLTLAVLSFRPSAVEPIPLSARATLAGDGLAVAIPVSLRHTARGLPVAGVGFEYFGLRGLAAARGTLPTRLGDCVLGAEVAQKLAMGPGDRLSSDPPEVYDISRPASLSLRVSGVLAASGTSDDRAVFVDVATASVIEGLLHGHGDAAAEVDPSLVLARDDDTLVLSQALIEERAVDPESLGSFHAHGDPGALPLTAFVLVPRDDKAATILTTRVNAAGDWQVVRPTAVVDDLMEVVFRIKALFDTFALVLGASTALLVALIVALSLRLRAAEMATLDRIGASRGTVARLLAAEVLLMLAGALVLAGGGLAVTVALGDRLLTVF